MQEDTHMKKALLSVILPILFCIAMVGGPEPRAMAGQQATFVVA